MRGLFSHHIERHFVMTLLSIIRKYIPDKSRHVYTKSFLCVYVELPTGHRKWYRVGSKLYYAMNSYKKKHGHLPYKEMKNAFIVIPLTPYFADNKASMGVGRIVRLKYRKVSSAMLCCRSQFVLSSALDNNLYTAYKYLRHDYGRFSRLQIFINLYNWKHNKI